ncbi:MAG TPA: citrate synthase, partial [Terrabacter sp.]|nr:citrate synthase [Terrabacter sp.]
MTSPRSPWITTTEAAQRLGVKRATLYAYVSRGLLRSERRPGQQESLFDRAQIDAMATAARPQGGPQPVLRFRSIATSVSSTTEGELSYRGRPLADVVALDSLEGAAAVVLGTPVASAAPVPPAAGGIDLAALPLHRRMPVAVQLLAAADPFAADTDPERVRVAAVPTLRDAVTLLAGAVPGHPAHGDLAAQTLAALGGRADAPGDVAVLRVLLVALLDHGLTASTVAARVAASTRAGLPDCLCAAYAAMAGPLHGAAPVAAHALLAERADPA